MEVLQARGGAGGRDLDPAPRRISWCPGRRGRSLGGRRGPRRGCSGPGPALPVPWLPPPSDWEAVFAKWFEGHIKSTESELFLYLPRSVSRPPRPQACSKAGGKAAARPEESAWRQTSHPWAPVAPLRAGKAWPVACHSTHSQTSALSSRKAKGFQDTTGRGSHPVHPSLRSWETRSHICLSTQQMVLSTCCLPVSKWPLPWWGRVGRVGSQAGRVWGGWLRALFPPLPPGIPADSDP